MNEQPDVVVVGAGPAGLAAAATLGRHGADVLVVDEQQRPGGQIYRQPPAGFTRPGRQAKAGRALLAEAESTPNVRWLPDSTAWGVFGTRAGLDDYAGPAPGPGRIRVGVHTPDGGRVLEPSALVLTAGAYDLPVPFPGWTLPGVLTAGGVQTFVKAQGLLPGHRFVLAGGHPLLLVVAAQLVDAGARVVEVAFSQHPRVLLPGPRDLLAAFGSAGKLAEGAAALRTLRRARVPIRFGTVIRSAHGDDALDSVNMSRVDSGGVLMPGTERIVGCDVLALGYGFVPSTELARQAGCAVDWRPGEGGWVVAHDAWMRTSVPGVSVAGELTGVAGAEQAEVEGRLAAYGTLQALGLLDADRASALARPVRRVLARRRRFAAAVLSRFAPAPATLGALVTDETVLCRCEEVRAGDIRQALAEHPHLGTANAVKLVTRAGMGLCQGRSCAPAVCGLIAAQTGRTPEQVGTFTAQPPVKPVPLDALAAAERHA
ncbi:NAD(P)/FAD-dependent oxidoreductase [Catellatospora bangladeshensis]|uniref:Pyridine nucleotide-disulfide oxidoreductase n=1 Tax=Catellatospora bangladeshensis TaxID=310355 RepID=A0A8J3NLD9_9ACTN|nr:NAD(P)/FAD-dependent oxidoreductase [Catellatospora bangladeshensis]GIF84912.1 pyridine nucleotide-disulfide oxidoreductase [Catellatospora bangladeshensis]